jgi:signal transduction histidine kinase
LTLLPNPDIPSSVGPSTTDLLTETAKSKFMLRREIEALRLLNKASDLFSECNSYENTLSQVTKLLVSGLSTWCTIDLVGDDGKIERVAGAHCQPAKAYLVKEVVTKYPPCPNAKRGVYRTIETRQSILISHIPESAWAVRAESPEHLRLIMDLGSSSFMCIPLLVQGNAIGAMMLLSDDRTFDEFDMQTAEAIANRLAAVIDTAKKVEQLQKAIKARDEFLAIAAHEIRNPLSLIAWHLESLNDILSQESAPEVSFQKIRESLNAFQAQMGRLGPFFSKLLDRSHIDSPQIHLELSPVNFLDLVKNMISRYQMKLQENGTQVILKENVSAHPVVGLWDQDRLEQVVANLISNAMKYGERNDIVMEVASEADQVSLLIHDHGIGIPERDQCSLFEPFQRLKMDSTVQGTGLGMYISKRIVEAHGGRVSVHSIWGQGTTFRICLPLKPPGSHCS